MSPLLIVLVSMFLQQTFISLGRSLPAVIAPAIILDLQLAPAWIGVYFGISAMASLVVQLGGGSFIVRYGAMRMSQVALVLLAIGTALSIAGTPLALVLWAILNGSGSAFSTPASSHLLARVSPPRYMPLVFSIKQTAVPAGLLLAGLTAPQLTEWLGWRATMLLCAVACLIFAAMLQPLCRKFDTDRVPTRSFRLSDFGTTLSIVLATKELRAMSLACLAFNGVQAAFTAYFVVYLTTIGYTPVAAGFVFSVAVGLAVPGRIVWGWLSSGRVTPRMMLAGLAFGMAGSVALLALCGPSWPVLLVGLIACVVSATALSWHGVMLAEAARAAPQGMSASVVGGVLSFGQVGAFSLPLVYAGLLEVTGSYGIGFIVCSVPALIAGVLLIRHDKAAKP